MSKVRHYPLGDTVDMEATFRNDLREKTNPDTVTATVKAPSTAITNPTANPTVTGVYLAAQAASEEGVWYYRFVGVGNGADAVAEGSFCVDPSSVI